MSKKNGNTKAKTWLITGASSGLGYALTCAARICEMA